MLILYFENSPFEGRVTEKTRGHLCGIPPSPETRSGFGKSVERLSELQNGRRYHNGDRDVARERLHGVAGHLQGTIDTVQCPCIAVYSCLGVDLVLHKLLPAKTDHTYTIWPVILRH